VSSSTMSGISFAVVSLFILFFSNTVVASPCIAFDASFNLLAFGLGGKDWSAGTQDTWKNSAPASEITASGRPPFDGSNTTCYLSQFYNAIYVMGADSANPSSVYIYNVAAKSWSTQSVTTGSFDPASFNAILDHDTNVFYALSNGELFFLDMGSLTTANSSALSWVDVQKASFTTAGYEPVMALAQNHIHFLDVPGVPAGSADIFVIHFSWFQPDPQAYPLPNGGSFPATHGQATSFFQPAGVQQEFAFIPDDGSATYVINVETNTTQSLAGPATKDPQATYFAGITSLVQLSSSGVVSFLPYLEGSGNATTNQAATWSNVASLANVAPASKTNNTASGTAGGSSSSGTAKSTPSGNTSNDLSNRKVGINLSIAFAIAIVVALSS
jgi:hypothetical protein